jgi:hypothetical protein
MNTATPMKQKSLTSASGIETYPSEISRLDGKIKQGDEWDCSTTTSQKPNQEAMWSVHWAAENAQEDYYK